MNFPRFEKNHFVSFDQPAEGITSNGLPKIIKPKTSSAMLFDIRFSKRLIEKVKLALNKNERMDMSCQHLATFR